MLQQINASVSCTFYQLWSYDVAVTESNVGIFMQSRRNIRNCAMFGNFSFYFSFSAKKELLLMFRLFFGQKKYFSLSVVLLFRPKTEKSFSVDLYTAPLLYRLYALHTDRSVHSKIQSDHHKFAVFSRLVFFTKIASICTTFRAAAWEWEWELVYGNGMRMGIVTEMGMGGNGN